MSSEGSQLGSSRGDAGNTMHLPYDYSSARSVGPSIREAAQGLAHLAMIAGKDRTPQYSDDCAGPSMSRERGDISGNELYQHAGHSQKLSRAVARAAAGGGPSRAERGEMTPSLGYRTVLLLLTGLVRCVDPRRTDLRRSVTSAESSSH